MAVSAGFAPVALGTEVDGSLVQPAARAALYALKPTVGATDLEGTFAVSEDFDSLGAMAKSASDLAILTEMLLNEKARTELPSDGYLSFMQTDFEGLKIGFVDPEEWHWPEALQPQHDGSGQQMVRHSDLKPVRADIVCAASWLPWRHRSYQEKPRCSSLSRVFASGL